MKRTKGEWWELLQGFIYLAAILLLLSLLPFDSDPMRYLDSGP